MPQICPSCSRASPDQASYCYFDGKALGSRGLRSPVDVSRLPFLTPFTFPKGPTCHNFNELALACLDNWKTALELLRLGEFERFLAGVGRIDLATAARQAAPLPAYLKGAGDVCSSPDPDSALDHLLSQLPANVLTPPRLHVEPSEIHCGELRPGADGRLELRLINQGMRLLQGTALVDSDLWLSLGDGAITAERSFQFLRECVLPLRIVGQALRASVKPLQARLVLNSNGGQVVVMVQAQVPVRPFPDGVLAGARAPRGIAKMAKAFPQQAAALFESGAVANWYRDNGWDYPVRIPAASGLAAIQQFFEALGLVQPPAVELDQTAVTFQGSPGSILRHVLKLKTQENRAIYAHGVSNQSWLEPQPAELDGRTAALPLMVKVPDRVGESFHAQLKVTANGNRCFVVPVTLTVGAPSVSSNLKAPELPASPRVESKGTPRTNRLKDLVPLAALVVALLGVAAHDLVRTNDIPSHTPSNGVEPEDDLADTVPVLVPLFHDRGDNRIAEPSMRFGLVLLQQSDPLDPTRRKRLTCDELGRTNNTCLRVDGSEFLFGHAPGRWQLLAEELGQDERKRDRIGLRSVWALQEAGLVVTQHVEIVPGEQTRLLDTCLVRYTLVNQDAKAHSVGLRVLLDTYIGARDGVPFLVPGQRELCHGLLRLQGVDVPKFVQALEREDLQQPGTVACLHFRPGAKLEGPERVTLGAWPDERLAGHPGGAAAKAELTGWDVPVLPMKSLPPGDSAVTLYWGEQLLNPGQSRDVGFTYGLGNLASGEGKGRLAVTVGGAFVPEGRFVVTAYVSNPVPGQTVTLELPAGFTLAAGEERQQIPPLPPGSAFTYRPVTWQVRGPTEGGRYSLRVTSSNGLAQSQQVLIRRRRIFD